ncbi:ATP-binding protein [Nitrospirillum sp. BR 11752]|uniref:sensor histidine kinase n=1 Tax=Nitrospirillum sp. BR 11752 TaxID=3104293 RepID=UPI002E9D0615|nr:ATP-binding protein [Nitrospirillum sp. BR 11752]
MGVLYVSGVCFTLTVVGFILTNDYNFQIGIANASISLLAIGATTYLAIRIETARLLTERAQADLAHVARVTTLGEMAASIAHEVNQPLAAIITNANACTRWLRATPPNLEKIGESIASMVDDAERASDIIRRIRALATHGELKKAPVGINDVIRDVVALMQSRLREDQVIVRTHLAEDLPLIVGDQVQLQQVVLNLLTNAVDAINAAPGAKREIRIESAKVDKDDVMVSVEDEGVGISPSVMSTLFDAFKSTKQGGMGIGLSICRSIIESHGGAIWATPNRTAGATFHFTVPGERKKTP